MKKLYYGGPILTMDREMPRVSAVLTENGRISAVGDIHNLNTTNAQRIDLQGRTLMPGFVDGHSHAISVGLNMNHSCELTGCTSFEEMLERIRDFRREKDLTHGEPIRCRGYDPAILKEGCHPTAKVLDALGVDNPIGCFHQSGHLAVYNSVAMRQAGVDSKTFVCPKDGYAGRDEKGELTGYFEESAKNVVGRLFSTDYDYNAVKEAVRVAQDTYIRHGFTTIQEGGANQETRVRHILQLAQERVLKIDLVTYLAATPKTEGLWKECIDQFQRGYRNRLKIGGVKLFLDGSPQARTAWLTKPYEGETEYRGYPMLRDEQVEQRLRLALKYGLQTLAHCNGDAASEQYLAAYEKLAGEGANVAALRPVMVHAQMVRYDQLERMTRLGMMPSFFVGHCYFWGDTHIKNLGDRGYRISPMKRALEQGLVCSLHQDSPVTPPDMLHSIWCAVNRISRDGVTVGQENKVDCYEALIAATNGGAYTYFEEDTKGILRQGAVADFVILDRDPTAVDSMEIKDIHVLQTIKEDQVIYTA